MVHVLPMLVLPQVPHPRNHGCTLSHLFYTAQLHFVHNPGSRPPLSPLVSLREPPLSSPALSFPFSFEGLQHQPAPSVLLGVVEPHSLHPNPHPDLVPRSTRLNRLLPSPSYFLAVYFFFLLLLSPKWSYSASLDKGESSTRRWGLAHGIGVYLPRWNVILCAVIFEKTEILPGWPIQHTEARMLICRQ